MQTPERSYIWIVLGSSKRVKDDLNRKTRREFRIMSSVITKLFNFLAASTAIVLVIFPSLQSIIFPPAGAIRSAYSTDHHHRLSSYRKTLEFQNAAQCGAAVPHDHHHHQNNSTSSSQICNPSLMHIAMTLDSDYLRGSVAAVHSILQHSLCPENIFLHFLLDSKSTLYEPLMKSIFPKLSFRTYYFHPAVVSDKISASVREELEQPLNYARNYLCDLLEPCVPRVIYLDSDVIVVDDVSKLWKTKLGGRTIGAPEYCQANFTNYFTANFWSQERFSGVFSDRRRPCYFNTGVLVIDLVSWRRNGYTKKIEQWMEVQRGHRIYELGSLPPFLLVFAGNVAPIEHRWNQHGLGGDSVNGSCRDMHPGPVSLLHWSGQGKPWSRVDSNRPCPLDLVWSRYDLYGHLQ